MLVLLLRHTHTTIQSCGIGTHQPPFQDDRLAGPPVRHRLGQQVVERGTAGTRTVGEQFRPGLDDPSRELVSPQPPAATADRTPRYGTGGGPRVRRAGHRTLPQAIACGRVRCQFRIRGRVARLWQEVAQDVQHLVYGAGAVRRSLGEEVPDQVVQFLGNADVDAPQARRQVLEVLGALVPVRLVLEGPLAGEEFEEHTAERVEVHRSGDVLLAPQLLRGHVPGAARGLSQRGVAGRIGIGEVSDTEVQQLHRSVRAGDDHVARFQVAVHHAVRVRVCQGFGNLDGDGDSGVGRERPTRVQEVAQADPLDVFHDEVGLLAQIATVQQTRDPGVLQLLEDRTLAFEPFQQLDPVSRALSGGEPAVRVSIEPQHLDRGQLPGH